ncbi:MAG TPA: hypothetical protein VHY91_24415 [Pirellulales bacterium]|nr:hypothetical protein [Pirellulales bacterium]
MPKFVVLDHSLRFVGGHYFEYALQMLRAAERQGWQPALGAHWDLGEQPELLGNWEIYRSFRGSNYASILHKLYRSRRQLAAAKNESGARAWARVCRYRVDRWRYKRRYVRLKQSYAASLDEIWAGCRIQRGDQMFLATTMPLDIAGLADWARQNPAARDVDWHLQIHFPLVDTATWYAHGSRQFGKLLLDAPEMLQDLLRVLPRNRVHLYATTESLAGQLQHCLGERFQTLPYPVNTALADLRAGVTPHSPLRATCAGEGHCLKGVGHWPRVVAALRDDYFATGRLQLALQTKSLADLPEPLRELTADLAAPRDGRLAQSPVVHAAWPLSPPDYLRFLGGSDIGLLMYDNLTYHVRCSGVLVEMLSAGVPVVAPAGCWLADQISEPIFAYQQQLRERLPVLANLTAAQLDWKIALENPVEPGIIVGVDTPCATFPGAVCQTAVPAHASHLLILLERDIPNPWNYYSSVNVEQRDADGKSLARRRDIVGHRDAGGPMTVLVPLHGQCRQIEIRLQTAFGHEPFLLRRIECSFLAASDLSQPARGAVGQLASDAGQVADCLRDIVDHYDHYEKSARAFAATWAPVHTAGQVLSDLTARAALPAAGPRGVVWHEQPA